MKVSVDIHKSAIVPQEWGKVFDLLEQVEISAGECFPNLEEFTKVGENVFFQRLKPLVVKGITLKLYWEAEYFGDRAKRRVWWTTREGSGNAGLNGSIDLTPMPKGTRLDLNETFWLQISLPSFMAGIAKSSTTSIVGALTDRYFENLKERFSS